MVARAPRGDASASSMDDQKRLGRGVVRRVGSLGSTSSIAICDVVGLWDLRFVRGGARVGRALWAVRRAGRFSAEGDAGLFYVR